MALLRDRPPRRALALDEAEKLRADLAEVGFFDLEHR